MKRKIISIIISILIISTIIALVFIFRPKTEVTTIKVPAKEVKQKQKELNVNILRYEQDVFHIDKTNAQEELNQLAKKYPFFIPIEQIQNPQAVQAFLAYLNDPIIQEINQNVAEKFPSLDTFTQQFVKAYSRYMVLFPKDTLIPTIITSVPGIDTQWPSVFLYENYLHIHLDLYLGANNKFYKQSGIPLYISERMDKKYLLVDCFKKAIVYKQLPENTLVTLLDHIIYEGKKLYFTQTMLPDEKAEIIMGYNSTKYQWAEDNYGKVWGYIVENNQLFSKNETIIRQYIGEAPFTNPFGNNAPGRLGQYLGWKIINAYMKNNPDITLDYMMQNIDAQDILNKSQFKPTK